MVAAAEEAGVTLMTAYNKRYDLAYLRFTEELHGLEAPRMLRVTTLESPFAPYVAHYPLVGGKRPPAAIAEQLGAEADVAIAAALDGAGEFERKVYRWVLLDTLASMRSMRCAACWRARPAGLRGPARRQCQRHARIRRVARRHSLAGSLQSGFARYEMEFAAFAPDRRITLAFPSPFLRSEPTVLRVEEGDGMGPRLSSTPQTTSYESAFKRELLAFHAAVTTGASLPTSGSDGVRDVALCEQIIRSYREGRQSTIRPTLRMAEQAGRASIVVAIPSVTEPSS